MRSSSSSQSLLPTPTQSRLATLIAAGDEASLRAGARARAGQRGRGRRTRRSCTSTAAAPTRRWRCSSAIPESDRTRPIAAAARLGTTPDDDYDAQLTALLARVKDDDDARQQFVDILELMGPDDPRTADYRKRLTRELF